VSAEVAAARRARIGVLGGTFDPIHIGHLLLAEETRLRLKLDRVVFIPAGFPWRKAGRTISPAESRFEMVKIAIEDNSCFEISRLEMDREGPSFTLDTLRSLRESQGNASELWFVLGSDALLDLPNWKRPEQIVAEARLAVAGRDPLTPSDVERLATVIPGLESRIDFVPMPPIGISSSELRRRLREGRSCRYWLPSTVERYITRHGLYRDAATDG
jgi:nicotinate-nucleotide adenylyltransferase